MKKANLSINATLHNELEIKMNKKFAVGIVVKDRWHLTDKTLQSLYYADQPKDSYDLFIIDNGSSDENRQKLRAKLKTGIVRVKNLIFLPEQDIGSAWNLFMSITKDYDYRLKMDNDVVLLNTLPSNVKRQWLSQNLGSKILNEIPQSSGPIKGLGQHSSRKKAPSDSRFLDRLREFSEENNVDITGLVPVNPGLPFSSMWKECVYKTWRGKPYLFGACMLISKKCFDKIGYFNEKLPRMIDIEYTQRAIDNMINIGYHDWYHIIHIGAGNTTEPKNIQKKKYSDAHEMISNKPISGKCVSKWDKSSKSIVRRLSKHKILNME